MRQPGLRPLRRSTRYVTWWSLQRGGADHATAKPEEVTGAPCAGAKNGLAAGTRSSIGSDGSEAPAATELAEIETSRSEPGARSRSHLDKRSEVGDFGGGSLGAPRRWRDA